MRFGLVKHCDQHLRPVDLGPSGRLRVQSRSLQGALHARRIVGLEAATLGEPLNILVEIFLKFLAQCFEVGPAMLQDIAGSDIMQHRVEHVLEAHVFVAPIERLGHRKLQSYL